MPAAQHRAHLTWGEGPHMHLTVHADDEEGGLDIDADPDIEQALDVPSGPGTLDEAKEAAAAVLLAAGWHLHGDWVDEPNETTVFVAQTPADYDETDIMAGVPLPVPPAPSRPRAHRGVTAPTPARRSRPRSARRTCASTASGSGFLAPGPTRRRAPPPSPSARAACSGRAFRAGGAGGVRSLSGLFSERC
ncbi:hypothetical protein [Streptomyces mutabilis]|uniref:hypothetical protein n=1 Tax=Streptomyces mutabilis TaxID=67332 RepID=UPI0036B1B504